MEIDWAACGKRIKQARESAELSQEEFAEMISLASNSIGRIERGEQHPSVRTLWKMAHALNTSIDYLLDGVDSPQTNEVLLHLRQIGSQLAECTPKQLEYVSQILLRALLLRDDLENYN